MRTLIEYVMRGRRQAIIAALIFSFIPFLGWVGSAIMALVTLRKGAKEGFIILMWLILPNLALYSTGNAPLAYVGVDILTNTLPTWLGAIYLRKHASWLNLMTIAVGFALGITCLLHLLVPDINGLWHTILLQNLMRLRDKIDSNISVTNIKLLADYLSMYATGLFFDYIILASVFNIAVARIWQSRLFHPGGFAQEIAQVRIPKATLLIAFVLCVLPFLGFTFAKDLLPIIALPFVLMGFVLVHWIMLRSSVWLVWFLLFYLVLASALAYVLVILMVLAIFDSLYDIRTPLKIPRKTW